MVDQSYSVTPQPVPTPYQPAEQGGNVNIPAGSTGPSYSTSTPGPYITYGQNSGGMTNPANQGQILTGLSTNWATGQSTAPYPAANTPPAPAPAPSSSGGGSPPPQAPPTNYNDPSNWGFWRDGHWFQTPDDYNRWKAQQDYANNPINVDKEWEPVLGMYDTQKQNMLNRKQGYLDQFTSPYEALKPGIEQALTSGLGVLQGQRGDIAQQTESAITAAKKLFNDLVTGINQRYGGSNSVGDFAREFQGREFQNQVGNVRNTEGQNLKAVQQRQTELQTQHDTALQTLEKEKASALSKATQDFEDRIANIDAQKGQAMAAKAQTKLQELQTYRALAAQIQQNAENQRIALQQSLQAGLQALGQTVAQNQAYSGRPINLSQVPAQYAQMIGGGQAYNPYATQATGGGRRYDPYTGQPIA